MKAMKIITAVLLAVSMMLTIAGCSKSDDSSGGGQGGQTDIVLAWWGNDVRNERTQLAAELFMEQNENISIELQTIAWGDYWLARGADAAAKQLPTVMQQDWAYIEQYAANGHLLDLTEFIESGLINTSDVADAVVDLGRVGGSEGIFAMPIGINGSCMIYDKTLTDELGITINDNMNLAEFAAISKEIYEKSGVRTNWAFTEPSNPLESMLRAKGIYMMTPEGLGGTSEDYLPFFELLKQGIDEGWHMTAADFMGREGMGEDPMIMNDSNPARRSWMGMYWTNFHTGFQDAAGDTKALGLTTYPSDNPKASNIIRAAMYFSISTHATREEQEAGAALIDFWTNSVEANEILAAERGIFVSNAVMEALEDKMPESIAKQSDYLEMLAVNSSPPNPPSPAGATQVIDLLRTLCEEVTNGVTTPQDAAERLFSEGNTMIISAQ